MSYLIDNSINIFLDSKTHESNISPSEWYEQNMVMPKGSALSGKFSFEHTPYWKEPLDCASPYHPAKEISIMKGAQVGGTAAVLNPIVGYTIAINPGNMMFLTGHTDLSKGAMEKIDLMIDSSGIRGLIGSNDLRARNTRTGDTIKEKRFDGGYLKMGSVTNHNLLRQDDIMIMIVDDYDAAEGSSKFAGATRELVQKRTSAYKTKKKIYWVSSPQIEGRSNIEEVFNLGDKRYYMVPCPCCGDFIRLQWTFEIEGTKDKAGIHYTTDSKGRVDKNSVGYICEKCSGFFTDSKKYEMNTAGFWEPTQKAIEEDHYSYHISSLYSPPFMEDWFFYAQQHVNANPLEGKRNEKKHQTFMNLVLGLTYKQSGKEIKANVLQKNIRNYERLILPEKLSQSDGNGRIVLLTCACDLNGVVDDARLDYEILAWSESGSSYSIDHGSIGTFVPRENSKKFKKDRERFTYEHGRENSVWPIYQEILKKVFTTDTGRNMKIILSGVDTGHYTQQAYHFIDNSETFVVGLKGKDADKLIKFGVDIPNFKPARERPNLYLVEVNQLKDDISDLIDLRWDEGNEEIQPPGFMNYPIPSEGRYLFNNYFSHYESEQRITEDKDGDTVASRWVKVTSIAQNHFWDVRIYNMVLKEIFTSVVLKELKIKDGVWKDLVDTMTNN